jgi:hypothetical protein
MYLPILSVLEHNSKSLQWHQASFLAMKVSAPTTSNIFYTLLDKTIRASAIRSHSTKTQRFRVDFSGGFMSCLAKWRQIESKEEVATNGNRSSNNPAIVLQSTGESKGGFGRTTTCSISMTYSKRF